MKPQPTPQELKIDIKSIKQAGTVLRAVNHKLRQQMLAQIHTMQKVSVNELRFKLKLDQSVTSQHLALLRNAGFVLTERKGKFIYYSVNYYKLKQVEELSRDISKITDKTSNN